MQFTLVIAGTEVIKHPGISAAGASHEKLPYTAAWDSEFLFDGDIKKLPVSPAGIISPAVISKACLQMLGADLQIINAAAPIAPNCKFFDCQTKVAKSPETGEAIPLDEVERLFKLGKNLSKDCDEQIIAECVVGGTTTALGLLVALGFDVYGLVSSSVPAGNHELKNKLIEEGYKNALERDDFSAEKVDSNPLLAISAMGDPMQAVVAGMLMANKAKKIILAGGSQMIAIAALCEKLGYTEPIEIRASHWLLSDKSADIRTLLHKVSKNTKLISPLDFADLSVLKEHPLLKAYEQGHVKEGVGAGALLSLVLERALLQQKDLTRFLVH